MRVTLHSIHKGKRRRRNFRSTHRGKRRRRRKNFRSTHRVTKNRRGRRDGIKTNRTSGREVEVAHHRVVDLLGFRLLLLILAQDLKSLDVYLHRKLHKKTHTGRKGGHLLHGQLQHSVAGLSGDLGHTTIFKRNTAVLWTRNSLSGLLQEAICFLVILLLRVWTT